HSAAHCLCPSPLLHSLWISCAPLAAPATRFSHFPYTTLFRSPPRTGSTGGEGQWRSPPRGGRSCCPPPAGGSAGRSGKSGRQWGDRKSTRLNSSHVSISYAVFCQQKKRREHV